MRWKLLPVALSTAQQAHLGDVLVPLLGAISLLHRTPNPTTHFRFGPHSTKLCYLSWQRRSNCWTPGPSHPSPYLICDLVQSSTDFSLCWCRHLFLHPCSTTTRTLRIFFPRDLKSLAMASSLLHLMKGSVMIMNPPWDVLGSLQHSKTAHSSLELKSCWLKVVRLPYICLRREHWEQSYSWLWNLDVVVQHVSHFQLLCPVGSLSTAQAVVPSFSLELIFDNHCCCSRRSLWWHFSNKEC